MKKSNRDVCVMLDDSNKLLNKTFLVSAILMNQTIVFNEMKKDESALLSTSSLQQFSSFLSSYKISIYTVRTAP